MQGLPPPEQEDVLEDLADGGSFDILTEDSPTQKTMNDLMAVLVTD